MTILSHAAQSYLLADLRRDTSEHLKACPDITLTYRDHVLGTCDPSCGCDVIFLAFAASCPHGGTDEVVYQTYGSEVDDAFEDLHVDAREWEDAGGSE